MYIKLFLLPLSNRYAIKKEKDRPHIKHGVINKNSE